MMVMVGSGVGGVLTGSLLLFISIGLETAASMRYMY